MSILKSDRRMGMITSLGALPLLLAGQALAEAAPFECDLNSREPCTMTIAPQGGAGATLTAPGVKFKPLPDGRGFEVRGRVKLGGTKPVVPGISQRKHSLYQASLVVEYANPARPDDGFRRLRGTAVMRQDKSVEAQPGFGALQFGKDKRVRVDVGLELGSVLQDELEIQHLNPLRPCNGLESNERGFRECPYWIFRVVNEQKMRLGFGGTDVGLNASVGQGSRQGVTFLMDPEDFFVYVGYTNGRSKSPTLQVRAANDAGRDDEGPLTNNDKGIGFSQTGQIPFVPRTTWGIESELERLGANFLGHLVIDRRNIPLGKGVMMDGSAVFKFPLDEFSGEAKFDNHWQAGANGHFKVKIPFFKQIKWTMDLGDATAGALAETTRQNVYLSGVLDKEFPWKPEGLPLALDARADYRVAAVLANRVDPDTQVPFVDLRRSFLQMEGEYLVDFSLGNPSFEFGREIRSEGFLRADPLNGIEFWGSVGEGAAATMIHPLIQADAEARLALLVDPGRPAATRLEVAGEFRVGGETFAQQARLLVTPGEGYLGFPLSFDPARLLEAYNDIQDGIRSAEAEVSRLAAEIERQRGIVRAERERQQAGVDQAQQKVDGAQAEVSRINTQIARHQSNIRYYEGRISSWYRWYQDQPWYKKATAWTTYQAKRAYYKGLIAAEQVAIAAERAALTVATAALDVARRALDAARAALVTTPIDLDPRVGPLLVAREVALEVLQRLLAAMPEIPEIPGTIEATAGFRIDGDGLTAEARATYCHNGSCSEIRGGSYDREAGLACITLPGNGGKRVCTAVPAEPT